MKQRACLAGLFAALILSGITTPAQTQVDNFFIRLLSCPAVGDSGICMGADAPGAWIEDR